MKITERKLRRVIRGALLKRRPSSINESVGFAPMRSRADAEFAALIKGIITEDEAPDKEMADDDFKPGDSKKKIAGPLKKLLDPELPAAQFAKFDDQLDKKGTPQQQGQALAGFALTYADNVPNDAIAILKLAIKEAPKMAPQDNEGAKE